MTNITPRRATRLVIWLPLVSVQAVSETCALCVSAVFMGGTSDCERCQVQKHPGHNWFIFKKGLNKVIISPFALFSFLISWLMWMFKLWWVFTCSLNLTLSSFPPFFSGVADRLAEGRGRLHLIHSLCCPVGESRVQSFLFCFFLSLSLSFFLMPGCNPPTCEFMITWPWIWTQSCPTLSVPLELNRDWPETC